MSRFRSSQNRPPRRKEMSKNRSFIADPFGLYWSHDTATFRLAVQPPKSVDPFGNRLLKLSSKSFEMCVLVSELYSRRSTAPRFSGLRFQIVIISPFPSGLATSNGSQSLAFSARLSSAMSRSYRRRYQAAVTDSRSNN